ncbi:MAG: hypothetical protein E6Q44_04320 [Flavobacteriales bacterium]|nr:MAG: hypothetical protein E6Q44_04320 [Flavobacteriales bacterium]
MPLIALTGIALTGCGRLDQLQYDPPVTPAEWCVQRPCVTVGQTVVNEPLGTVLVFALAALWVGVGIYFLVSRRGQRSRAWLGVALILGGLGAAQAGVSYQAFSYELKCAGEQFCRYTNGFEVGYSLTQAWSVSAMLIAVAYACAQVRGRRLMIGYAIANAVVYCLVLAAGVLLPDKTLLSFEVLMLFALPGVITVIVVSAVRYRRTKDTAARWILWAAILLIAVQVAYFAYYAAGVTQSLWDAGAGVYFSENDVLHVGMVAWLVFVAATLGPRLRDTGSAAAVRR